MIDIATVVGSFLGQEALKKLLKSFQGNKKQLQKAYDRAFENAVRWYEKKYGEKYGTKNNRFFDYQIAEEELAKLLLLRPEPDLELISQIELKEGKTTPPRVVQAFVNKLRQEMGQLRECEELLVEREKFLLLTGIKQDTRYIPDINKGIKNMNNKLVQLVELKKKELGLDERIVHTEIEPDPTPINWQELERVFREEYRLDRLDYGHLGTTREQLEHKLELQKVYVALKVKDRMFERLMKSATITQLTPQVQKNLPLLFQRVDELLRLEQEKDQRLIHTTEEMDEQQTQHVAQKILKECDRENIRGLEVIIKEFVTSHKMERKEILQILLNLSSRVTIPRPLADIPAKHRFHLLIGDAGAGKSTVCRYLALRCFDSQRSPEAQVLQREFGITEPTPLPIYLRLEDFGKMAADYPSGLHCLLACAANFWKRSEVFRAGQLYHAMMYQPVWLFLDGLDEIANPHNRRKLAECVHDLTQFPQLRITLTSRPAAITDELLDQLIMPYFHVLDLEQPQIDDFAHKYFEANLLGETAEQVKQQAQEFLEALDAVPVAKHLASNPLLLTVIAVLHYKEGKLPQYRAELYEKCIEQLMAQKAATPGRLETGKISFRYPATSTKPIIEWNHNQITDMLRDLAFHAHQRIEDEVFLTQGLMLKRLQESDLIPPALKTSAELEQAAKEFLDECDRLIGVLAFRGGHYVFIHRTFQEYLAAHWLSLQREVVQKEQLRTMLQNPAHWQEVIRLFFNRLGKTNPAIGEELVEEVNRLAFSKNEGSLILLAAQCLADFEEYQPRYRLHHTIKTKLEQVRDKSHASPQLFLACGDALGLMDEPQIDVADPPMVYFEPKEPFKMGSEEHKDERPVHPVKLSPYWLGKYPVTNKEFAEFIKSGGYENEAYWFDEDSQLGFDAREFLKKELKEKAPRWWLDERFGKSRPLAPVVGVSWYEALAYCRWWTLTFGEQWAEQRGLNRRVCLRLPTEAEWEFAARGFEGRRYPWGHSPEPSPELANYDGSKLGQTSTVGSYPKGATPEGIMDLAGNIWEWCSTLWGKSWEKPDFPYPYKIDDGRENLLAPGLRVLRGGSWFNEPFNLRGTDRLRIYPRNWIIIVGFRCARVYL